MSCKGGANQAAIQLLMRQPHATRSAAFLLFLPWLVAGVATMPLSSTQAATPEILPTRGGVIELFIDPAPTEPLHGRIITWVTKAADAVSSYYGRFPVARLRVYITVRSGRGVSGGTTYGWSGAHTTISIGRDSTTADFDDDWIMTHEMVHLGFPSVARRHHWIEEGLATYVEPVARVRVAQLSAETIWRDMLDGMPKGLPETGDRGLDFTPTWARTYWGGALFCLTADVEIRRRTGNAKGLEHALRAIVAAGGTIESDWELRRALEIGDRATGVPVLTELYEAWRDKPVSPDLPAFWRQLGITRSGGGSVRFDAAAPLAAVRERITSGR